jgi:hypothetical protein
MYIVLPARMHSFKLWMACAIVAESVDQVMGVSFKSNDISEGDDGGELG